MTQQYPSSLKKTLRRIITAFGLILSAMLIVLAIGYAWVIEDNIFNRLVLAEAKHIEQQYLDQAIIVRPRSPYMTLHKGWNSLSKEIQKLHSKDPGRVEFPTSAGKTLHIQEVKLGNENYVLSADVSGLEVSRDYLPKLFPWLIFLLFIVATLAFFLTQYLIKRIVSPIEYVAKRIKEREPKIKLHFNKALPKDEIGYLANSIKDNINQLQDALIRESNFTRDISHELRTPTTVLKMIISRLSTELSPNQKTLDQLHQSLLEIEQTIEVLLAIAREESLNKEPIKLLNEIEECLINHKAIANNSDLILEIDIHSDIKIYTNKNLLHIVINNLIQNGLHHASTPKLSITMPSPNILTFANPSKNQAPNQLFTSGSKGSLSRGIGQGLFLVKRICENNNWQLEAQDSNSEFRVSIKF